MHIRILCGLLKYVQPRPDLQNGLTYHRSHLSSKWSVARPTAMRERRLIDFEVAKDGQSITTVDRQSGISYNIPLLTYRRVTLYLVQRAEEDVERFIQSDNHQLYQMFDHTQLSDNSADATSVFCRLPIIDISNPFTRSCTKFSGTSQESLQLWMSVLSLLRKFKLR